MTYTAPELIMILGGVGVLLTGVGASIVNIVVALKTGAKMDTAATKTEGLISAVQEVHTLTNSGLSAVKAELATSVALNLQLRDIIADLKSEREKAAIAGALGTAAPVSVPAMSSAVVTGAAEISLKQIDKNTKAIEENTAKTDVTVQGMKDDSDAATARRRSGDTP